MEFVAPFLPTHLDPGQGIDSLFSFAETLTKVDANGEVVPSLLAEEPRSEGPSEWTLTLKPDMPFQNGSPLDGDALAACLALDVSVAAGVLRLLSAAADGGTSVLMASHDRTALQVLCHRILQMRERTIVSEHRGDRAPLPGTTAQVAPLDGVPAVRGSGSSPNSHLT